MGVIGTKKGRVDASLSESFIRYPATSISDAGAEFVYPVGHEQDAPLEVDSRVLCFRASVQLAADAVALSESQGNDSYRCQRFALSSLTDLASNEMSLEEAHELFVEAQERLGTPDGDLEQIAQLVATNVTSAERRSLLELYVKVLTLGVRFISGAASRKLRDLAGWLDVSHVRVGDFVWESSVNGSSQNGEVPVVVSHDISRNKQAYVVLGVQEGATQREIKRAYRKLIRRYHPDTLLSESGIEDHKQAVKINEAYALLSTNTDVV